MLDSSPQLPLRFNIAPTQNVAVVRKTSDTPTPLRDLVMLQWGLIPSWAKDAKMGARMINARGETVAEKPSFRAAFKRRRCLVLADGYALVHRRNEGFVLLPIHGAVEIIGILVESTCREHDRIIEAVTVEDRCDGVEEGPPTIS